jgi:hypothetical protein
MTREDIELLGRIKTRMRISNNKDDELLFDFLRTAKSEIMARRFPYGNGTEEFPSRYNELAIQLTIIQYNKMGAEGENAHSENGVSRSYDDYNKLLYTVVPMVGVIK